VWDSGLVGLSLRHPIAEILARRAYPHSHAGRNLF
jgi:hypothetical protein